MSMMRSPATERIAIVFAVCACVLGSSSISMDYRLGVRLGVLEGYHEPATAVEVVPMQQWELTTEPYDATTVNDLVFVSGDAATPYDVTANRDPECASSERDKWVVGSNDELIASRCPFVTFVFYTEVEISENEEGHTTVEVVQ